MQFSDRHYDKIKLGLLFALMASLPFYFKLSNVLIGAAAGITLLKALSDKKWRGLEWLSILFLIFFALEIVGLIYTQKHNFRFGLFTLDKHQAVLYMVIIFADLRVTPSERQRLLWVFILSCFIGTIICVLANVIKSVEIYQTWMHEWRFSHHRLSEPIGIEPVYFAIYLSLGVIVMVLALADGDKMSTWKKCLILMLSLYFLLFIGLLGARTIGVTLVGLIVTILLVIARKRKSYSVLLVATVVPVVFITSLLLNPVVKSRFMDMLKQSGEVSSYGSYFARTNIWKPGMEAIKENVWIGVGTGDYEEVLLEKFRKYKYQEGVDNAFNMHNQYLQMLLTFGIAGLLLFLSILVFQAKYAIHNRDILYLAFVILFAAACVTESMLTRNKGVVFFLVFSFLFYYTRRDSPARVGNSGRSSN